jgi:hypothetical protein
LTISMPMLAELISVMPRHQLLPACQARFSSATMRTISPSSVTT